MRIGVLTHHWVQNFGANLQALATYRFLTERGHDVTILNYRSQDLEDFFRPDVSDEQTACHEFFCDTFLKQSPICRSSEDLEYFSQDMRFDVILVGSDAVFRLRRAVVREDTRFPNPFWLIWANSRLQPRPITAALAASSMGTRFFMYPAAVRRGIGAAVQAMTHVSVRDRWTQWMLWILSWGQCCPQLCPDPVIILNDVFSIPESYAQEARTHHKKYIILSLFQDLVPDEWVRAFVQIAHERDLQVFSLPFPEGAAKVPVDKMLSLPMSPLTWYSWIQHAAGYVGPRFHPLVSAMANGVPFVSLDTYQWRFLPITSKSYDICSRAKMSKFWFNKGRRRTLSPARAFELFRDKEQSHAKTYVAQARDDFARIVPGLLLQENKRSDQHRQRIDTK